jgi:hypothetical protein
MYVLRQSEPRKGYLVGTSTAETKTLLYVLCIHVADGFIIGSGTRIMYVHAITVHIHSSMYVNALRTFQPDILELYSYCLI